MASEEEGSPYASAAPLPKGKTGRITDGSCPISTVRRPRTQPCDSSESSGHCGHPPLTARFVLEAQGITADEAALALSAAKGLAGLNSRDMPPRLCGNPP